MNITFFKTAKMAKNLFYLSYYFLPIVLSLMFGPISGRMEGSPEGFPTGNAGNQSKAISVRTGLQSAVNFSCLDLVNYWSQLFAETFVKPFGSFRQFPSPFGDLSQLYFILVSLFNFFQITLNDLRSQLSGIECMAEQFSVCKAIDNNLLKFLPSHNYFNHFVNHANFYLTSNHNFNPLFAVWNSGYLSYKCLCKTC